MIIIILETSSTFHKITNCLNLSNSSVKVKKIVVSYFFQSLFNLSQQSWNCVIAPFKHLHLFLFDKTPTYTSARIGRQSHSNRMRSLWRKLLNRLDVAFFLFIKTDKIHITIKNKTNDTQLMRQVQSLPLNTSIPISNDLAPQSTRLIQLVAGSVEKCYCIVV